MMFVFSATFLLIVSCCSLFSTAEDMLTCDLDNQVQRLQCDNGLILIHNVTMSHRESEACVNGLRPPHLKPPICSTTPVLHKISTRCNGQYKCSIPMSLCHSSEPCLTRCVWMDTSYTCQLGKINQVCQKRKAWLYCGSQVIRVLMANYGRTSKVVCKYHAPHSFPPNTKCRDGNTLKVMAARCDGKHKCSVRATNQIFSNHCPGTHKYLQFSYICVEN
ncbi:L-rhamnose-binding lectin CSL3-like [Thalassophryne amazonica]|uniref:L-rhamnose-binding lectin CSL3-like n=1 Tax=Thalassophryne amazonica TaxID=390379 RepID=UPI0014724FCD|nr:L-rhamnose-binding lectin CSL3-like [Thalassophryne amazonica]